METGKAQNSSRQFIFFVIKFIGYFLLFYYGTEAVISFSSPGGYYIKFVADYLDYVSFIKNSLIGGSKFILSLFGINTYQVDPFIVRIENGLGVRIAHG